MTSPQKSHRLCRGSNKTKSVRRIKNAGTILIEDWTFVTQRCARAALRIDNLMLVKKVAKNGSLSCYRKRHRAQYALEKHRKLGHDKVW